MKMGDPHCDSVWPPLAASNSKLPVRVGQPIPLRVNRSRFRPALSTVWAARPSRADADRRGPECATRTDAPVRLGNQIAGREGAVCFQARMIVRRRTSHTNPKTGGLGKTLVPARPAKMISQVRKSRRKLVWHRQERRVTRMQRAHIDRRGLSNHVTLHLNGERVIVGAFYIDSRDTTEPLLRHMNRGR